MSAAPPAVQSNGSQRAGLSTRALIVIASGLSAIFTSGLALGVQYYSTLWEQQRTERVAEASAFVSAAQQFDPLVTRFMEKFLLGQDTTAERRAIRDNLQLQFNSLETAKANLDEPREQRATEYQASLTVVARELTRDVPAPEARELVQAIANVRAANVCVVYDLRDRADLPTIASDREPCDRALRR